MGFYKRRPTIREMVVEQPELLNSLNLSFMGDNTAAQLLVRLMIMAELGDMQTICDSAAELAAYLVVWSAGQQLDWSRWYAALTAEYNPIHNYDRTEEETEGVETTSSVSGESSSENGGQDVHTVERQGYNAADYVPADKDTTEYGGTGSTTSSTSGEGTTDRTRDLHVSGNIGVMTNQAMIQEELNLRSRNNIARTMVDIFLRDICVGIW